MNSDLVSDLTACLCRIQVDSKALQILRERANINSACDDTDFRYGIEIQ